MAWNWSEQGKSVLSVPPSELLGFYTTLSDPLWLHHSHIHPEK